MVAAAEESGTAAGSGREWRGTCGRSLSPYSLIDNRHAGVVSRAEFFRNAKHEQRAVVMRRCRATEFVCRKKNGSGNVFDGSISRQCRKQREKPFNSKFFMLRIFRFDDSIRSKHEQISRLQVERQDVVIHFWQQPKWYAFNDQLFDFSVPNKNGMRRSGTCKRQLAFIRVVQREKHCDKAGIETRCIKAAVQHLEHFLRRTWMLDDVFP